MRAGPGPWLRVLGRPPRAARAKYARLLRGLRARPVTTSIPAFDGQPRTPRITFTYAFTVSFLITALGVVQPVPGLAPGWAYGAFALQTLWKHSQTRAADASASPEAAASDPPPPEQGYAVLCADSPNPRNPAAYRAEAAYTRVRWGAAGPLIAWGGEPCAGWRATDADGYFGPWGRRTAHPILLVGNTFDPQTPYQDSVAMAGQLARARLLTVDGYGHTALANPSQCLRRYETSYFLRGTLPPAGTVCQQNQPPFSTSHRT